MTDVLASLHPKPVPARSSTEDPRAIQHDYIDPVDSGQFWSSDEGPTFAEFLDIINPLQHNSSSRRFTGPSRVTRSALGRVFSAARYSAALPARLVPASHRCSRKQAGEVLVSILQNWSMILPVTATTLTARPRSPLQIQTP
ncbi:MAG: hypothetical protein HOI96_12200 [Rhodospirillaceae bacterium]|nr:hypothetical protein [Rhodospirillaceae bacterium]